MYFKIKKEEQPVNHTAKQLDLRENGKNACFLQQKCHAFINEKNPSRSQIQTVSTKNWYFSISKRLAFTQSLSRHLGIDSPQNHCLSQRWQLAKGKEKPGRFGTRTASLSCLRNCCTCSATPPASGKSQGSTFLDKFQGRGSLGSEAPRTRSQ